MENEPERPPPKHVYLDVEKFWVNGKGRFTIDPQDFKDERSLIHVHLGISPHEALRIEMMIAKAKAEAKAEAEAEAEAEQQQQQQHHQEQQEQQQQQQEEPLFEVDALTAALIRFQDYYSNLCARICWIGLWVSLALLGVCTIALLLLAAMQGIHDHYTTASTASQLSPTTQKVAPPTNLFSFDAGLLAQSMTPARLNESKGTALFKLVSLMAEPVAPTVEEENSCATHLCHILVAAKPYLSVASQTAKPYLPAFLHTYLLEDDEGDDKNDASQPIDYFDWVITVDQASLEGTTPAFLPSGRGPTPTTEESASSFFEMTLGHAPKIKKSESVVESESAFDTATAWPGTDSFSAIVRQVIDFGQSTSDSIIAIFRSATTPSAELRSFFSDFLQHGQEIFWTFFSDVQENFWTYLILYVTIVSLDIFWDVRFWSLDYPLGCLYPSQASFFLRTVSHLLLNARLSRVPLFGAQILSKAARGIKETLRWLSKIGWREAARE